MTPVAQGIDVAEVQALVEAFVDARQAARDLACHERLAANRRLVIEEYAVAGEEAVGFAVIHRDPVGVDLGRAVGRTRDRTASSPSAGISCTLPYISEVDAW